MSVIGISPQFNRGGSTDRDGSDSTRAWRVEVNSQSDNETTIVLQMQATISSATPSIGMRVDSIDCKAEADKGWRYWWVEVRYTNRPADPNKPDDDGDKDPLNDPVEIDWDSGDGKETIRKDLDGNPIQNSAYDRFDTDPEIDVPRPVLVITKNFATFDAPTAYDYGGTVNEAEWQGAEAGTLLLRRIRARKQIRNGIKYWAVTCEFEYDPNGWQLQLLDQGYNEVFLGPRATLAKRPIKLNGEDCKKPQMLNGLGFSIAIDDLQAGTVDPVYLTFRVRREKDFNALNLGV